MKLHTDYRLLELVTDAEAIRDRLAPALSSVWERDVRLTDFHVPRVYPRPSGAYLVQYSFRMLHNGSSHGSFRILYGEHFPVANDWPPAATGDGQTVSFDDLRLRVWVFPADPKLSALPDLFRPEQFISHFAEEMERSDLAACDGVVSWDILSYRLARRFVGRVCWAVSEDPTPDTADSVAIVKMAQRKKALALWTKMRQLEHNGFGAEADNLVRLPQTLFIHPQTGTVFQRCEPGQSLHQLLHSSDFSNGCALAAEALGKLVKTRVTGLPSWAPEDELAQLAWWVETTANAFPALSRRLKPALVSLRQSVPDIATETQRLCHRDFYDKQLLFDGHRGVLLDCDTLAEADPALDYGNFVAHLQWRMHQHPENAENISAGVQVFRDTYGSSNGSFQTRATWWQAASTLRLVCIYSWRPRWRALAPTLLGARALKPKRTKIATGGGSS